MFRNRVVLLVLFFVASACGGASRKASVSSARAGEHREGGRKNLERYFPLEEGKLYHYATREGDTTGMLVAKVHRTDATHGELQLANGTKRFVFAPDGVAYDGGAYLLKAPGEVGTSWEGEHGGTTRIEGTDLLVEVPAGRYTSCLKTVEEGGRLPGSRYETTYCPNVGMVLLVVSAGGFEARAELKSYGMPAKIE